MNRGMNRMLRLAAAAAVAAPALQASVKAQEAGRSWTSSHLTRGGCSQEALRSTGGDGLFYCFAAD